MTIRLPGCREANPVFQNLNQHSFRNPVLCESSQTGRYPCTWRHRHVGHRPGPGNFFTVPDSVEIFFAKFAGKFSKNFNFFSNTFSTKNYFLDHATSAKFFSDPVQEPQDSRQVPH